MDYLKFAYFCCLLCVFVLAIFMQEKTCVDAYRRPSPPVKKTCPPLKLVNGFARLRSKGRIGRYLCNEGYKIVGEKTTTCVRGQWEGSIPLCVKTGCLKVYAPKNGHLMEFYAGAVLGFFCENGYSLNGSRSIYCNGITWNGTVPTCQVDNAQPQVSCDFEAEDICGWTQDAQHNFDWRRHNFATPSGHVGTGPSYDHTRGMGLDGNYMYIESSSPRMVNDSARLLSPVYPASLSEDACFVFWYHMYGATTGSLRVYQKDEAASLAGLKPLFSRSGDKGNQWFRGLVRLNETNKPFQMIVEGVRGSGYVSDSAIDDVQLTNGTDCVEPVVDTSQSSPPRIETGGGGEVFDDGQSCRARCSHGANMSSSGFNDSAAETPVMVTCDCHVGCLDNGTCCPDYSSYCIMAKVTPSLPVVPTLGYRTIATVHYFPSPPPRPTPHLPPPLPPLPPKPTLVTSPEPPNQTPTDNLNQSTDTVTFPRPTPSETSTLDYTSVEPTSQSFSETSPTNLRITANETPPETTDITYEQFISTIANTINSELPETELITNPTDTATAVNTPPSLITLNIDNNRTYKSTSLPMSSKSTATTTKTVKLTTEKTTAKTTIDENLSVKPSTKLPMISTEMSVKQLTVQPTMTTQNGSQSTERVTVIPTKRTTPRRMIFVFPVKKTYPPKRTTTTTTIATTVIRRTTKNKMMYYPNYSGDKSANEAETNYLLKKELINQPKQSSGIPWPQTQQASEDAPTSSATVIVGIVGAIALLLVAVGVVAIALVRRRRAAGGRGNMSDDSDVRFLTADEVLDFNIGRPSEEDGVL